MLSTKWLGSVSAALIVVISLGANHARAEEQAPAIAPLPTPPPRSLTLAQALELATHNVASVQVAELQVNRARAAERTALAVVLPMLNGVIAGTAYDSAIVRSGLTVQPRDIAVLSLQAQEVISPRTYFQYRESQESARGVGLALEDARRVARASVAKLFFAVLSAKHATEIARSQLAAAQNQDRAVAARVAAGAAVPLDRARVQLAVFAASQLVADSDTVLAHAWDLLGQGLSLDEPIEASETPAPRAEESLAHYVDRALGSRPDLAVQRSVARQNEMLVTDAWTRFLPSLSLTWTGTYRTTTTSLNPNQTAWNAVAALTIPFYDGGARYAALDDAHAAVEQARTQEESLRRNIRVEVRDAYRRAETAARAIQLAQQSLDVATTNAALAQRSYEAGALTGIELEDSRRLLEQAQVTLLSRTLDREVALVDLLSNASLL